MVSFEHLQRHRRSAPSPMQPGLARVAIIAQVGQARLAVGEGWGGGWFRIPDSRVPPSLSLPHKGGGDAVARPFATREMHSRKHNDPHHQLHPQRRAGFRAGRAAPDHRRNLARPLRPLRRARELCAGAVRLLHGAGRRHRRLGLSLSCGACRREEGDHRRRPRRRRQAYAHPGRLPRDRCGAVRLLHAGLCADGGAAARRPSRSRRRRDQALSLRQSLPLRGLSRNHRRR